MYEPQHLVDSKDGAGFAGDGPDSSWLSAGEDQSSSPVLHRTETSLSNASTTAGGPSASNVDRVLFKDLVEIVPLVQSLIDRKAKTSFTRRASMVYTKTPSRELLSKKTIEAKGRNGTQSIPAKKRKDLGDKDQGKNAGDSQDGCGFSDFSSSTLPIEKDQLELIALREQVEDLKRKLLEKDELLMSAEISKNQMTSINAKLDELKHQASHKESLLKSTQQQLTDARIKLADKQASLEKLQWEAMTSERKLEKFQEDLDTMQGEMSSFMLLFDTLAKDNYIVSAEDYDVTPYSSAQFSDIDNLDEIEMQKMEAAREAYISAVTAAKEKQDEVSISMAANARLHLQSFVFRTQSMNSRKDSIYVAIPRGAAETHAY